MTQGLDMIVSFFPFELHILLDQECKLYSSRRVLKYKQVYITFFFFAKSNELSKLREKYLISIFSIS